VPIYPYILIFECLVYLLFAGCLYRASRQGRFQVLELLWAGLYGFLLEWLTLKQLHAYHYGPFLLMIDDAPLAIALGWAVIIYSSMGFTGRLQLAEPARPILDALLALNIDLALDAVAIRLGLWAWQGVAFDQQWFGVPWANFLAWFVVIWSYSGFIRALRSWQHQHWRRWLYMPLAMLLSLLVLVASNGLYRLMADNVGAEARAPLLLIGGSLLIVLGLRPGLGSAEQPEPIIVLVPIFFHTFALVAGIGSGIFARYPVLAVIEVTMLVVGLGVHVLYWWVARSRQQPLQA
jgi:hypothetical protein